MKKQCSSSPEVSVLLPCYNGARWLDEAINSVLSQTFKNFELIVVDDGSSDNSPDIIKCFAAKDNRIVVISKENSGLADSLNVGISHARGAWIARIDADDICEPNRLEIQLAKAKSDPQIVFVGSGLLLIDEHGNALKTYNYPVRNAQLVKNLRSSRKFPPHSSAFFRADVVRAIGGYRNRILRAEDRDLWLRLSEAGKLTAIRSPLVKIRRHSSQISHDESGRRQQIDSRIAIISYWIRRRGFADPVAGDDDIFDSFRTWVTRKLNQENFFEYFHYLTGIRAGRLAAHKPIPMVLGATRKAFSEPRFLLRYIRGRMIGDFTGRQLALEWIKNAKRSAV